MSNQASKIEGLPTLGKLCSPSPTIDPLHAREDKGINTVDIAHHRRRRHHHVVMVSGHVTNDVNSR